MLPTSITNEASDAKAAVILRSNILGCNVGQRLVPSLCLLQDMRDNFKANHSRWQERYDSPATADQVLADYNTAIKAIERLLRNSFYADTNP